MSCDTHTHKKKKGNPDLGIRLANDQHCFLQPNHIWDKQAGN